MFVPNRKKFSMGMLLGIPASIDNTYVLGSGVGARSVAVRRILFNKATKLNVRETENTPVIITSNAVVGMLVFEQNTLPIILNNGISDMYSVLQSHPSYPEYDDISPMSVSNNGLIVGTIKDPTNFYKAILWASSTSVPIVLPIPDNIAKTRVDAISLDGSTILGQCFTAVGDQSVKCVWKVTSTQPLTFETIELDNIPGFDVSQYRLYCCNNDGTRLYGYTIETKKLLLWEWNTEVEEYGYTILDISFIPTTVASENVLLGTMITESPYTVTIGTLTFSEGYTFTPTNIPNRINYAGGVIMRGNNGTKVYGLLYDALFNITYFYYSANDDNITVYSYPFPFVQSYLVLGVNNESL